MILSVLYVRCIVQPGTTTTVIADYGALFTLEREYRVEENREE